MSGAGTATSVTHAGGSRGEDPAPPSDLSQGTATRRLAFRAKISDATVCRVCRRQGLATDRKTAAGCVCDRSGDRVWTVIGFHTRPTRLCDSETEDECEKQEQFSCRNPHDVPSLVMGFLFLRYGSFYARFSSALFASRLLRPSRSTQWPCGPLPDDPDPEPSGGLP